MSVVNGDAQHEDSVPGRRRRTARRVATGTVLVVIAGASLAGAAQSKTAGPEQVLQAVNVKLGTDGSITSVADTDIRKDQPGFVTTTTDYAPASVASKLPVGISMSYLVDGVPGTDVKNLADKAGRIEVDVTVTNRTVKPVQLSYPVGGAQHTQYALVGSPMTVTATATLPKGSFASVVSSPAGSAGPHTTNGVVSSDAKGASTVQWAALLAPPTLSPTTTFALVEQADHFQLPSFTLAVSPGMNADPSVTSLLNRTFGSSNALLATQNQTINLVNKIDGTLGGVSDDLDSIQAALSSTAGGVGQAANETLTQARASLTSSSQELSGDLSSLQTSVSGSVQGASSVAGDAVQKAVSKLVATIGVQAAQPQFAGVVAAGRDDTTGCAVSAPTGTQPTLLAQLTQVTDVLRTAATATGNCLSAATATLHDTIGDSASDCTASASLVCQINTVETDLTAASSGVAGAIQSGVTPALNDTTTALSQLQGELTDVGTAVNALLDSSGSKDGSFAADLATVKTALGSANSALAALEAPYATVYQDVSDQIAALGAVDSSGNPLPAASDVGYAASKQYQVPPNPVLATLLPPPATVLGRFEYAVYSSCLAAQADGDAAGQSNADYLSMLMTGYDCAGATTQQSKDLVQSARVQLLGIPAVESQLVTELDTWVKLGQTLPSKDDFTADTNLLSTFLNPDATGTSDPLHPAGSTGTASDVGNLYQTLVADLTPAAGKNPTAANLAALKALVATLTSGTVSTCPTAPASGTTPAPSAVNVPTVLGCIGAFTGQGTGTGTLVGAIITAMQQTGLVAGQVSSGVNGLKAAAAAAGSHAQSQLQGLLDTLVSTLNGTATSQLAAGTTALAQQARTLTDAQGSTTAALDANTMSALASLDTAVGAADGSQMSASSVLQQLVAQVQADLGSGADGSHTGILGAIQSNATQTGIGSGQIDAAAQRASSFRGVRQTDVANNVLVQQQLKAAQDAAQAFPVFGPALPAGSTHTTVFVYHLASIG